MTIIPAIDILDGKCVRLTKGDYSSQKIYCDTPLDMALLFQSKGFRRIHLVDLNGAGGDHIINRSVLHDICSKTGLTVDFGGGIKSDADIESAFDAGASMVTVGSIAVSSPDKVAEWAERYGADRIILGADARNGKISINGWKEDSQLDLFGFIRKYKSLGIKQVICTDINLDGTLQGPATGLYRKILAEFPDIRLTASGGVSSTADLTELKEAGLDSAIVGKAYYEGRITLDVMAAINDDKTDG